MTEWMSFLEKMEVPDFVNWVSPHEAAEYYRKIWQPEKAQAAIAGAAQTPDKVIYILTDPGMKGFKRRWVTGVSYVDINLVGEVPQSEVIQHEGIHNTHESRWWRIDIPGWDTMTDDRKKVIYETLGIGASFGEIDGIEGLTQYATQKKVWKTESGYDAVIVPQSIQLFEALWEKSGRSTVGAFVDMALYGNRGGKEEFAHAVRIGGNIILLERTLLQRKIFKYGETAQAMSRIIEKQKEDFIVRDMGHANRLVDSYLETVIDLGS